MKYIKLTKDKKAIIDDNDFEWLNKYKWYYSKDGYAIHSLYLKINGKNKIIAIRMHRILCPTKKGFEVDHINRNKLDNRRSNLRVATRLLNMRNQSVEKNSKTGYRGVNFNKDNNNYRARIAVNRKIINLGSFKTIKEAHLARLKGEKIYWGGIFS